MRRRIWKWLRRETSFLYPHVRQIIRRAIIGWEWEVVTWSGKMLHKGNAWNEKAAKKISTYWAEVLADQIQRGEIRELPRFA